MIVEARYRHARQAHDRKLLNSLIWVAEASMNSRKPLQIQNRRGTPTRRKRTTNAASMGMAIMIWMNPESPSSHHTNNPPKSTSSGQEARNRPRLVAGGGGGIAMGRAWVSIVQVPRA